MKQEAIQVSDHDADEGLRARILPTIITVRMRKLYILRLHDCILRLSCGEFFGFSLYIR